MSTKMALDIFILITYIVHDDISKSAVISAVQPQSVIINSCLQNSMDNLIPDGSEIQFS